MMDLLLRSLPAIDKLFPCNQYDLFEVKDRHMHESLLNGVDRGCVHVSLRMGRYRTHGSLLTRVDRGCVLVSLLTRVDRGYFIGHS